jgi:hypothetical protein
MEAAPLFCVKPNFAMRLCVDESDLVSE